MQRPLRLPLQPSLRAHRRTRWGAVGRTVRHAAVAGFSVALLGSSTAGPILAQEGAPPDLNGIALDWALGSYVTPLFCEIDGVAVRGVRRINIIRGPSHARPAVDKVVFMKLDVENATRCFTELSPTVSNFIGHLQIRVPGKSHPETALRDFRALLKRKGGVEFEVPSGRLASMGIGPDAPQDPKPYDLRRATARIDLVRPGTDAARVLADLPPERRIVLEIETRDGERLNFPLALDTNPR